MNYASYIDRYLLNIEHNEKKPGTIKQYRSDLQQFISWFDSSTVEDLFHIDTTQIASYAEYLKKKKNFMMQRSSDIYMSSMDS